MDPSKLLRLQGPPSGHFERNIANGVQRIASEIRCLCFAIGNLPYFRAPQEAPEHAPAATALAEGPEQRRAVRDVAALRADRHVPSRKKERAPVDFGPSAVLREKRAYQAGPPLSASG